MPNFRNFANIKSYKLLECSAVYSAVSVTMSMLKPFISALAMVGEMYGMIKDKNQVSRDPRLGLVEGFD